MAKPPKDDDCISRKIGIHKKEGMPQDQAVAVAIKKCKNSAGGYNFSEADDGMYVIHDVPIMAEVPRGEKGNRKRVGKSWMVKAVLKAKKRFREDGYKAPLHVEHHGKSETRSAGFVRPTAVRQFKYEGKPVYAIFADLEVTPEILTEIKERRLPYRSVEIFTWDKPEINSLALLTTEVPFFRFDVLTLNDKPEEPERFQAGPVSVCSRPDTNGCRAILFSFKGYAMPEKDIKKFDDESRAERADVDRYEYEEGKKAGEDEKHDLQDRDDEILDLLRRILEAVGGNGEDEVEEITEAEVVEAPVEQSALAALSGKIAALEARERNRANDESGRKIVTQAMMEIAAWDPDRSTRQHLTELVKLSANPEKTAAQFVASFKTSVPKKPFRTLEEFDASMGGGGDHPDVLRFAERGPDALDAAREASTQYDDLIERGMITGTRENFIETQINAANGDIARR